MDKWLEDYIDKISEWPKECDGNGFKPTHYLITTDFRGSKHKPVMLIADEIIWKEGSNYFVKRKLKEDDVLKELWI